MFDLYSDLSLYALFFILGLMWGSFANVVIVRLPQNESVVKPRSHCRSCKKSVSWYDNIPLFSYLFLMGKCRHCQAKISLRYPLVELLMGLTFVLIFHSTGLAYTLIEYLIFGFGMIVVSFIDLDHRIIPDSFSLSGIVIGLLGSLLNPERTFLSSLAGVLAGGGFLWLIAWLYFVWRKEEGMGGGDIKLLAWIGAVLGWQCIPFVIMVSSIIGAVVGILVAYLPRFTSKNSIQNSTNGQESSEPSGLKTAIPFGPFLSGAALFYILGGYKLGIWYLQLFFPWMQSN